MINFMVDYCDGLRPAINIIQTLINLLKWGIPILLLVFGTLDLGKAVMAGKEDEMKKAQGTLIKRVIYAVAVFLVFTVVTLVMDIVSESGANTGNQSWIDCWTTEDDASDGAVG